MANTITNIHVNYNDATDGPRSESLDPEEFDEGYLNFNDLVREYLKAGCTDIVIRIDTTGD